MANTESTSRSYKEDRKMKNLEIVAITEMGCVVYASIEVREDYTMNEVVGTVKDHGYKAFKTESMGRFVEV